MRDVGILDRQREDKQAADVDGLVGDGREHGRTVHLGDVDEEAARGGKRWRAAVSDDDADLEVARPLGLGRRPGKHAGKRIDRRALGRTVAQAKGERLRRAVRIGSTGDEGEQLALIEILIVDGRQHRGEVRLDDDDGEALRGREAAIAGGDNEPVGGEELRGRRGPGEEPALADGCARRSVRTESVGKSLMRDVGILDG